MQKLLLAGCALALLAGSAAAGSRHDLKLEQAVKDIVASKIGDIRGGLSLGQDALPAKEEGLTTASIGLRSGEGAIAHDKGDGSLVPARERPPFMLE